jgi:hypothetical protein
MSGQAVLTWLFICLMCSTVTGILCWYAAVGKMAREEWGRRMGGKKPRAYREGFMRGWNIAELDEQKPRDFKIVRKP